MKDKITMKSKITLNENMEKNYTTYDKDAYLKALNDYIKNDGIVYDEKGNEIGKISDYNIEKNNIICNIELKDIDND